MPCARRHKTRLQEPEHRQKKPEHAALRGTFVRPRHPHRAAARAEPRAKYFILQRCGENVFTWYGFCDGSLRRNGRKDDNRGGWSAMICNAKGKCLFGIYGPNPHSFPTAFNAELLAVIMMLSVCTPPITIWTGNQAVVDGWISGKAWPTGSCKTAADSCRRFWWHIKNLRTKHKWARVEILK